MLSASETAWWLTWAVLLAVDVHRGRRRLLPYLLAVCVVGLLNSEFYEPLTRDTRNFINTADHVVRFLLSPAFAWVALRSLGSVRAPKIIGAIGLVLVPLVPFLGLTGFVTLNGNLSILTSVAVIVGLFESAHRGERLPTGTDVTLGLLATQTIVLEAVQVAEAASSSRLLVIVWDQVNWMSAVVTLVCAAAHYVNWPRLVRQLG